MEFPEGWGGFKKNPFRGEGMGIFWNYTFTGTCISIRSAKYMFID